MSDTPAEARPKLSDAQRADMLAGVDNMIYKTIRAFRIPPADVEDAAQTCRLKLWVVSARFDPVGSAKWSTFAGSVITTVLKAERERVLKAAMPGGRAVVEYFDEPHSPRSSDTADADDPEAADDERAGRLLATVRRQAIAAAAAGLTPVARKVVTAIVADGLTAAQAADQLGVEPKMIAMTLRRALGQMAKAGHVPAALAERFGFNARDLADGTDRTATVDNCAARRELVAEAIALGQKPAAIAAGLGVSLNTVTTDLAALKRPPRVNLAERVPELVKLGLTVEQIAADCRATVSQVQRQIARTDLSEQITAGYRSGLTTREIAERVGLSPDGVRKQHPKFREKPSVTPTPAA